jgi:glycosidase
VSSIRFYYLHPLLAGPIDAWAPQLERIAAMGFDAVVVAPPFAPGRAGNLFLTADHDRLDPRLGTVDAIAALSRFAEESRDRRLRPMLDVVIDRVAGDPPSAMVFPAGTGSTRPMSFPIHDGRRTSRESPKYQSMKIYRASPNGGEGD